MTNTDWYEAVDVDITRLGVLNTSDENKPVDSTIDSVAVISDVTNGETTVDIVTIGKGVLGETDG